jgi:hypothetical protein
MSECDNEPRLYRRRAPQKAHSRTARTYAAGIAEFKPVGLPVAVAVFDTQCLRPAARVEVCAKRVQVAAKKSAARRRGRRRRRMRRRRRKQRSDEAEYTCCHQMCCCVR